MTAAATYADATPRHVPTAPVILHLLDTDAFAGTERHVLELLTSLRELGVACVLGCRADSELLQRAKIAGLEAHSCWGGSGPWNVIKGISTVRRLVQKRGVRMLHAHNGRTSLTAACVSWLTGVKAVATQHFIHPQFTTYRGPKRAVASVLHNWVNHQLGSVLCVSQAARQSMLGREKISPSKLVAVPNGVSPLSVTSERERTEFRKQLGVSDSTTLIVSVCRLEPEKDVSCLLSAFALLRVNLPSVRLVIAGDGSQRESLQKQAEELSISQYVTFLGFRSDVATVTGAADVFVLPSPAEPFGLAILEAMSIGKAVVACNAGGPAEILSDGVDGLLATPSDPASLAEAISKMLRDPSARQQLGVQARETYERRFTSMIMGRNTLAVYQSVLGLEIREPLAFAVAEAL